MPSSARSRTREASTRGPPPRPRERCSPYCARRSRTTSSATRWHSCGPLVNGTCTSAFGFSNASGDRHERVLVTEQAGLDRRPGRTAGVAVEEDVLDLADPGALLVDHRGALQVVDVLNR